MAKMGSFKVAGLKELQKELNNLQQNTDEMLKHVQRNLLQDYLPYNDYMGVQ